jgi:hypothetical protein
MKIPGHGSITDDMDDSYAMGESTALECVKEFAHTIIDVYEVEYLRTPNQSEVHQILQEIEARGFPGMLGSIDCMHWEWASCPVAYHGAYRGHKGKPIVILEDVAMKSLRIWHAFFGLRGSHNDINVIPRSPVFDAGSHNDINVIQRSPVFDDLAHGRTVPIQFNVNNHEYTIGYYLVDKIYPEWATIVKTKSHPVNAKDQTFATTQESARKDVERVFDVLRSKFRIIQNPYRLWSLHDMNTIMRACIILHNMILEDERHIDINEFVELDDTPVTMDNDVPAIQEIMARYKEIMNKGTSRNLQEDLVQHHWFLKGAGLGPYNRHRGHANAHPYV